MLLKPAKNLPARKVNGLEFPLADLRGKVIGGRPKKQEMPKISNSGDNRQQTNGTDPRESPSGEKLPFEVDRMKREPDNADYDVNQAYDHHSKWSLSLRSSRPHDEA